MKEGRRKTYVIRFHTTVHFIFDLAQELFADEENKCERICTYYLLQDYLENFFSMICQHGGCNDNPTPVQFKYIMRKLIIMKFGGLTPSLNGNCSIVPDKEEEESQYEEDLNDVINYSEQLDADMNSPLPDVDNLKNRILVYQKSLTKIRYQQHQISLLVCQLKSYDCLMLTNCFQH